MHDKDWLTSLFRSVDEKNTEQFVSFLTDDAVFRYGSAPPAVGRTEVKAAVSGFFDSVDALRHRLLATWSEPGAIICQGEVTYRIGEREILLPFVNVFRMREQAIAEYLIYIDPAPLQA